MTVTQMLLLALIPTILIELAVLLLLRERSGKVLMASVAVNILTNVPLNLYVNYVSNSLPAILCGEALVVLVETLWYCLFLANLPRSFMYSFICNAISFLTGLLAQLLYILFQNL